MSKFLSLGSFFYVALFVQLLLQVSANTVGLVVHLHLEIHSSHLPDTAALRYLVGF